MKRHCVSAALMGLVFLVGTISAGNLGLAEAFQEPSEAAKEDGLVLKARRFLDALSRGDFPAAAQDFDAAMMQVSGPAKLEELWKQIPAQMGAFRRQTKARRERLGEYEIALVTCEFEKVTLDARVVFNKARQIAGFHFVPSVPPAEHKVPAYADASAFQEREVVIGKGTAWELPGTLSMPNGKGPFPGLVLVHGSGPNDRDETLGPNKPFKDLAWGLATRGIAVLRYEKRTRVYGPKIVSDKGISKSFTVKEETVDDALAAVELLQGTAGVDKKRVCVLGHSLGGMLIPRIGAAGAKHGIAGFIIMAGLTRSLEDTMIQQMTYILGIDGSLSEDDRKQLAEIKGQADRIKAMTDADRALDIKPLNAPPAYWLDLRGYDPPLAAKTIWKPFLVLQGSRDYQVTVQDFDNWKKALEGKPRAEFKLYPKLNHLFFEGTGIATPNEYLQKAGNVADYVINDISAFIKSLD